MAELLATIDPSGAGDYLSLLACEAGENRDWVTAGDTGVWQFEGDWTGTSDAGALIQGGLMGDSPDVLEIRTDAANRHAGIFDSSKAFLSGQLNCRDDLTVTGLQVQIPGNSERSIRLRDGTYVLDSVLIRDSGIECEQSTGDSAMISNCLLYGTTVPNRVVIRQIGLGTTYVSHCTLDNAQFTAEDGVIVQSAGVAVVRNTIVYGGVMLPFVGTFDAASDYNATSGEAMPPGANSVNEIADPFVDVANNDYTIADDSEVGGGLDLTADPNTPVTVDIVGVTRSSDFTRGAFQVPSGGGGAQRGARARNSRTGLGIRMGAV